MAEKTYQWDAADYARHSAGQYQWAQELIDKLELTGSERVLDLGCGDGKVSALIAGRVPRGAVVGVDRSLDMLHLAQQKFAAAPNLAFAQMDASALGFREAFEVAFSNAALHWVIDQRPVLAGVARSLRPGGRILFQMGGQGNGREIFDLLEAVRKRTRWQGYFQGFHFPWGFYGPEEYRALLEAAGLHPLRVELIPKDMQHAGREGLAGWGRTTWLPYLTRVPKAQRDEFMEEILSEYLAAHPLDAQGKAHVAMVRLEVAAVKRKD